MADVLGEEDEVDMEEVPETPSDSDPVVEQGGDNNLPRRERATARIRRVERLVPQLTMLNTLVVYQLVVNHCFRFGFCRDIVNPAAPATSEGVTIAVAGTVTQQFLPSRVTAASVLVGDSSTRSTSVSPVDRVLRAPTKLSVKRSK